MSRPSWFEFTTAILGFMRKSASPCIKKGLNALQQWSTGGHWNYMLINVRQPFTVGILIVNTKLQILSLINRVGKSWFHERFRCCIWFRIKFCFSSPSFSSPANSAIPLGLLMIVRTHTMTVTRLILHAKMSVGDRIAPIWLVPHDLRKLRCGKISSNPWSGHLVTVVAQRGREDHTAPAVLL